MRLLSVLVLSTVLMTSACSDSYERMAGGAFVGGAAGAATGALCCRDPGHDIGPGILIGIAAGALVGFAIDRWRND